MPQPPDWKPSLEWCADDILGLHEKRNGKQNRSVHRLCFTEHELMRKAHREHSVGDAINRFGYDADGRLIFEPRYSDCA